MDTGEGSVRDILNDSGVGPESDGNAAPPALPQSLSPGGSAGAPQQAGKLYGGKYKSLDEYDKAHKKLEGMFTKDGQSYRKQALEAILNKAELKKLAASDPTIKDALIKAGYSLAEVEEAEEDQKLQSSGDVWNGDENDARYQVKMMRRELELRDQRSELETELKRRLQPQELTEIKEVMRAVSPNMHVMQAWKLTPSFEKAMKDRQDKEIAKLRGPQQSGNRPPPFLGPQGQKGENAQKRPSQMSAMERREKLMETVRKNS